MHADQFLDRLHRLLADGSEVVITFHAERRMQQRDVLRSEILECLEWGESYSPPEFNAAKGSWKMPIQYHPAGTVPLLVVAAIEVPPGEGITVITVYFQE